MAEPSAPGGICAVLLMPYHENESIDFDTLAAEIDCVFSAGGDGIVIAQASEILRMTGEERLELTERVPRMTSGRGTVTISVGAETERQACTYAEAAEKAGADAVMAIPPVTALLPEPALFCYYKAIHDSVSIPVVVQDPSGYLGGRPMSVNFQARLRNELGPRICFKPEAHPIGPTVSKLQEALKNEAIIFDGSGGLYLTDTFHRGIAGIMPGVDLIRAVIRIWNALKNGDEQTAYDIHARLAAIVLHEHASLDAYLAIEKYLLLKQGIFRNQIVRRPVAYAMDAYTKREIDRLFMLLGQSL